MQLAVVVVFVSAFLLTGCSKNELPGDENTDTNHTTFTIEVSDGGYAPAEGEKPDTRAAENGYATQFTAGDKIGVFAVKNSEIVDGVNNLCFVATAEMDAGGNSSLVWKIEGVDTPNFPASADYYAYYPWQPDNKMTGEVDASKTNVDDFFAGLVNGWTTDTNQGTYTAYTGSDLMIASGTPSGKSLSFSMQHKMALVVIDLPRTKYTLTDANDNQLPDYIIDAPDTKFNDFTPCRMSDGTYRYLINPTLAHKFSGSYTNATAATAEWQFKPSVTAGQYGKYVVDGGTIIEETHQLQAGDFFMKDGTLLGKDKTPTEAQQAACIGIVYWVGDIAGDNYGLLNSKFPGSTHGLVVSLWDMPAPDNENVEMKWTYGNYELVDDWLGSKNGVRCTWSERPSSFTSIQIDNKMQGYANTIALKEYNKYVESKSDDGYGPESYKRVKPVKGLDAFETAHPSPSNSSGWYWPSVSELKYVCWGQGNGIESTTGRDEILNPQIQKVGADVIGNHAYWSSSESNYFDYSVFARAVELGTGWVANYEKTLYAIRVRPLLAF